MTQAALKQVAILLAEGQDEVFFFNELRKHLNINEEKLIIRQAQGIGDIGNQLKRLVNDYFDDSLNKDTQLRRLGIICDADKKGVEGRFQAVCKTIEKANKYSSENLSNPVVFPIPTRHKEISEINNDLQTAIYIMPGHDDHGTMLEGLCLKYLNDCKKERMACINALLECSELNHKKVEKAVLQIALAFEEGNKEKKGPRSSVGAAAQDDIWDFNHAVFDEMKTFLTQLTHDL